MRCARATLSGVVILCACLGGCDKTPVPDAAAPRESAAPRNAAAGVTLTDTQIAKLGILATPVQSMQYAAEVAGFGSIESHDAIAQAAAEFVTAQATLHMSHAALLRAQKLSGTLGAVSADIEDAAAQKERIDSMTLLLTTQKLSATFGTNPPWKSLDHDSTLAALASGKIKLVRATFPSDRLTGTKPRSLRAERIAAGKSGSNWTVTTIWDAPADGKIPGRSYFGLLKGDVSEGERLEMFAPTRASESGFVIPGSAIVMSGGNYWCYLERTPGTYVRIGIDTSRPISDGYFVSDGVDAKTRVVTVSAGQLLAVELGSNAEPD